MGIGKIWKGSVYNLYYVINHTWQTTNQTNATQTTKTATSTWVLGNGFM